MSPAASVVIPTYNRREYLRKAIASSLSQSVPVEVVVVDDGSTDGTPEMVRQEFPQVRFERFDRGPNGPTALRNRGTLLAAAPIVFPIDDDAEFVSPRCVEQTLADFAPPRVGAVGIPFVNVRIDVSTVIQQPPDGDHVWVGEAFVGACHALRRDLFLELGGYRTELFYMVEEGDLCQRMLDAGYIMRMGTADPMHHHQSPIRNRQRSDYFHRRNDIWFAAHNVPFPEVIPHLMGATFQSLRLVLAERKPRSMGGGTLAGWAGLPAAWRRRRPVSRTAYRLSRQLRRQLIPLNELEPLLPPMRAIRHVPPPDSSAVLP